ncbi:hypothetical protein OPU71_14630 [Niveibacterium sp. 24ML]|uniref:hypothetical protein n=1 Tax=Niveibacterium sp. 24ML TaxID=2985512 RepID=UPI00226D69FB|nr:hypothetical protein [Niveibacterium sp. 24ML]MCX9157362.1 hypothetical protein [Niveibacterium sp. 24ML]
MLRMRNGFAALLVFLSPLAHAGAGDPFDGARWLQHVREDLLPWWTQPAAQGKPIGQFPTFRCHDGRAYDAAKPCDELAKAPAWIRSELGRDYVRMQARQVYAYGMGFHLTGDPALLKLAEAGVRDIRSRALDPATGSPVTYWQNGQGLPAVELRNAQDVAYAGAALGVWYYLTRDAATLADLDRLHRHLMSYFDAAAGRMKWTLAGPEADKAELVAQLDPLNAYMVLVTPLLPDEMRARWQADMRRLTGAIRSQFCSADAPRCAGTLGDAAASQPGARHNDFGHTGKAFWMTWLAAEQTGDTALADWAREQGRAVLRDAYVQRNGSWARRWTANGVQPGNDWWIYAELDQLAATLAQRGRGDAAWLARTWPYWFDHFVEAGVPEVWGSVSPTGEPDRNELRQHQWKNGYHAMEHALVSYITAESLAGKPAQLYFAPSAKGAALPAYYYGGTAAQPRIETRKGGKVLVADIRLPAPADTPDAVVSLPPPTADVPPGTPVALTEENAAAKLLGEWEGVWLAPAAGGEGRLTIRFEAIDSGRLQGRLSAFDTGMDERTRDIPINTELRFENGQALVSDSSGKPFAVRYTLRRDGETDRLDWTDRAQGYLLQMRVSRVQR